MRGNRSKLTVDGSGVFGREAELDRIAARLREAGPTVTGIVGPAGIGKTHLARAVYEDVRGSGGHATWTRCWDGPGTPALWPWRQLIASLDLPVDLDGATGESASPVDGSRFAQFEAVAEALRRAADGAALLLIIDDIHWADPASLELIKFLARDTRGVGVHLLLTYRPVEATLSDHAATIENLDREAHVVQLGGLERGVMGPLVREDASEAVLDAVHERSGGNPFFAMELARGLARTGALTGPAPVRFDVPTSVRAAISDSLDLVSAPTREALVIASVQGQHVDTLVLATAAVLDPSEVAEMLREAEQVGIGRLSGSQFTFTHALIGDALTATLTGTDLERAHLATADATAKHFGFDNGDRSATVAKHLAEAGTLVPAERLCAVALEAAEFAGTQLAWEDESRHLAVAVGALTQMGASRDRQLIDVLVRRMEVEKQLRRFDLAHELGMEAAAIARRRDDAVALAEVALAFPPGSDGIEIDDIFDPDQRPLREEALQGLPETELALRSKLQAALALSLYWETPTGDRAQSHQRSATRRDELTASALTIARALGDQETLAFALSARIYATWGPSMRGERPGLAEELVGVALDLGDTALGLQGRVWRVADLLELGRLAEAEREIDAFAREALRTQNRVQMWTAKRWRANLALMRGDMTGADELALDAFELGSQIMDPVVAFHFYSTLLGPMQYLRCDFAEAIDYVAQNVVDFPQVPAWRVGLAVAAAETGDLDRAAVELALCTADEFALLPRDLNYLSSMMFLALAIHHVEDSDTARAIYDELAPYEGRFAVHGTGYASYGVIDIALGQTAETMGDRLSAIRHYDNALTMLDPTGSPYAAVARAHLASVVCAQDPERAKLLYADAATRFRAHGLDERATRADRDHDEIASSQIIVFAEGDNGWFVQRAAGELLEVGALKGHRALRELVTHPGRELHSLELAAIIEGQAAPAPSEAADLLLDDAARTAYAARLTELGSLLDEADARADAARSAELAEEFEAITRHLQQATFQGRSRVGSSNAGRARVSVTKLVKRAIERVREADADLGQHLAASVTTGMTCVYQPDTPLQWRSEQ